jgi:hypothetical protein
MSEGQKQAVSLRRAGHTSAQPRPWHIATLGGYRRRPAAALQDEFTNKSAGWADPHEVRVLHARIGMSLHRNRTGAFLSLLVWLAACSSAEQSGQTELDPRVDRAAFSTTLGEPNHEQITATALSFLRPEIITALQAANVATDVEFFLVNANHFDESFGRRGARAKCSA